MKRILISYLLIAFSSLQSWAAKHSLTVERNKLVLDLEAAEWINFCLNDKFGCARFKIKTSSNSTTFGFIKTLPAKSSSQGFKKICEDTFRQTKTVARDSKDFVFVNKLGFPVCYWSDRHGSTLLSLRYGTTIIISVTDKSLMDSLLLMLNRAKLHETH